MKIRLNKYLSMCGVSSRRGADELILKGAVSINGTAEYNLGCSIDPENDVVQVRGIVIKPEKNRYIILYKPKLYITALGEGQDKKPTIHSLISDIPERVYPVGRLDYDVEGLLVLTNDGELANRIHHPSYGLIKTYLAEVKGAVNREKCQRMAEGVELEDGYAVPDSIKLLKTAETSSTLEISFHEGRNHLVKRYLAAFKNPVKHLKRISVGPLKLGNLKKGQWRDLTARELKELRKELASDH